MNKYTTIGYKDGFTRISYILIGVMFLILLNLALILYVKVGELNFLYFVVLGLFGLVFFRMYKTISGIKYTFDDNGIQIHISNKRSYKLQKKDIDKIYKINKIPWWKGFGIKYDFWGKRIYFTTSISNILEIVMKDGRKIMISPKKINNDVYKLAN